MWLAYIRTNKAAASHDTIKANALDHLLAPGDTMRYLLVDHETSMLLAGGYFI